MASAVVLVEAYTILVQVVLGGRISLQNDDPLSASYQPDVTGLLPADGNTINDRQRCLSIRSIGRRMLSSH